MKTISKKDLDALVVDLVGAGVRVIAPVRRSNQDNPGQDYVEYLPTQNPADIVIDGPQPTRPLKEIVFPPTESLFSWKQNKSLVEIEENPTTYSETVVVGARPCDAAALEVVDKVMDWDYRDELWFGRREAVTIISVACTHYDDSCFCSSVGLAPDSERGSDLLLIASGTDYLAKVATPKGEAFVDKYKKRFSEAASTAQPATSPIADKVRANMKADPQKIKTWLDKHFDDPIWQKIALRCHGCGACAHVCPTCHCFDIVDELDGVGKGCRRRNWDACQPGLFTLHGSGHNPRKDQSARFRQRIMHKFNIYPSRFGEILCTGCGRCIRVCAAGMDLIGILEEIGSKAEEADGAL